MQSDRSFAEIFSSVRKLIPTSFKKRAYIIFFLLVVNSFAELFGIATIIPVFSILLSPSVVQESSILNFLYTLFGSPSLSHFVIILSALTAVFIVLKNFASILILRYTAKFTYNLYEYYSISLYDNFNKKGITFINNTNSNYLIRDIMRTTFNFSHRLLWPMFIMINELFLSVLIFISVAVFIPSIVLWIFLILAPIFYFLYNGAKKYIVRYAKELNDATPELNDVISQSIFGHTDIVVLGKQKYFKGKFLQLLGRVSNLTIKESIISNVPTKIIETFVIIGVVMIFMIGIITGNANAEFIGFIGYLGLAAFKILPSVNRIMLAMIDMKNHSFLIDELNKNLPAQEEEEKSYAGSYDELPGEEVRFDQHLAVKDVSFSYKGASENVLNEINISIGKGQTIGIIGSSGAGKSTLIKVILGFLKPVTGAIEVDGKLINAQTIASWRRKLGYVSQEVYLIDGSIIANIAFGEEESKVDMEQIHKVLKQVELFDFVMALPDKAHTRVGERGGLLSGGQRQRVGIARALYYGAEVLLMDEATSALDNNTEEEINKAIINLKVNSRTTVIIIAHRYTTLKGCDMIYELSQGRILRSWTYQELMEHKKH